MDVVPSDSVAAIDPTNATTTTNSTGPLGNDHTTTIQTTTITPIPPGRVAHTSHDDDRKDQPTTHSASTEILSNTTTLHASSVLTSAPLEIIEDTGGSSIGKESMKVVAQATTDTMKGPVPLSNTPMDVQEAEGRCIDNTSGRDTISRERIEVVEPARGAKRQKITESSEIDNDNGAVVCVENTSDNEVKSATAAATAAAATTTDATIPLVTDAMNNVGSSTTGTTPLPSVASTTTTTTTATNTTTQLLLPDYSVVRQTVQDLLALLQLYGPLTANQLEYNLPPVGGGGTGTTSTSHRTIPWTVHDVLSILVVIGLVQQVKGNPDQYCIFHGIPRATAIYPPDIPNEIQQAVQEAEESYQRCQILRNALRQPTTNNNSNPTTTTKSYKDVLKQLLLEYPQITNDPVYWTALRSCQIDMGGGSSSNEYSKTMSSSERRGGGSTNGTTTPKSNSTTSGKGTTKRTKGDGSSNNKVSKHRSGITASSKGSSTTNSVKMLLVSNNAIPEVPTTSDTASVMKELENHAPSMVVPTETTPSTTATATTTATTEVHETPIITQKTQLDETNSIIVQPVRIDETVSISNTVALPVASQEVAKSE